MRKLAVFAVGALASCVWIGCSTTIVAQRPLHAAEETEINAALEGNSAEVRLVQEGRVRPITVTNVRVKADTTLWMEREQPGSAPTEAIRSMVSVDRRRGAMEGLGIGLLTGVVGGAILGYAVGPDNSSSHPIDNDRSAGNFKPLVSLLFAVIGCAVAIPGALIGAGIGHSTTIDFGSTRLP